jgi:hypothetical protein
VTAFNKPFSATDITIAANEIIIHDLLDPLCNFQIELFPQNTNCSGTPSSSYVSVDSSQPAIKLSSNQSGYTETFDVKFSAILGSGKQFICV